MSGSVNKSKPKERQAEEFRALRGPFAAELEALIPSLSGIAAQPPSLTAGTLDPAAFAESITAEEQALVDRLFEEAFGTPETEAASDFLARTIGGEFLEPDPRTRAALQRPILEAFEEARRGDVGAFTRAGQRVQESSPFFRARALAQRGLAGALGDVEVALRERGRERQFQAAATAEARDSQRAATAVQRLQAVALPRLIRDLGVERGLEAFNRRVEALLAVLQGVAGVTQPVIAQKSKRIGVDT